MKKFRRRSFLKTLGAIPLAFSFGWARKLHAFSEVQGEELSPMDPDYLRANVHLAAETRFIPGYLSIIQGPTSDTESLINVFSPRLKKYVYEVIDPSGVKLPVDRYETVTGPGFFNIDKMKVSGLALGVDYTLLVRDGLTVVDERVFKALDVKKADPVFGFLSCMADDYRFEASINPMWDRLQKENPDFLILNGDVVYVDSFEFVERKKANEWDIWQRYTDSFRRIPLYHWKKLVPIFSTWDDHDFGTNDGDRDFAPKDAAVRLFQGAFGGKEIAGTWKQGPMGVSSVLSAFGQKFYFMDDRTFRQPNKDQTEREPYGHWGQIQHDWLIQNLSADAKPAWIINGNQCFNGTSLSYKEAFEENHPKEFVAFLEQLKAVRAPVVFGSGDIHFSEIMQIPKERIGYETYEFTSSCMHSYTGVGWPNPMRVEGAFCTAFNFMVIRSQNDRGALKIDLKCLGIPAEPYFQKTLTVRN